MLARLGLLSLSRPTTSTGGLEVAKRLSVVQQAYGLKCRFRNAQVDLSINGLVCAVDLEPSPLSRTYSVRIEYDGYSRPAVKVLSPNLERLPEQGLPHMFTDDELCLHLPEEWGPGDLITTTIIPWASEWLLHYEIWHASGGTWCGGGHEPETEAARARP